MLGACWKPHKSKDRNILHRSYTQKNFSTPKKKKKSSSKKIKNAINFEASKTVIDVLNEFKKIFEKQKSMQKEKEG